MSARCLVRFIHPEYESPLHHHFSLSEASPKFKDRIEAGVPLELVQACSKKLWTERTAELG